MGQNTTYARHVNPHGGVSGFAVGGPQDGRRGRSPQEVGPGPRLGNTRKDALAQVGGLESGAGQGPNPDLPAEKLAQLGRRRDRFAARAFLWDISTVRRVKACGRAAVSTDGVGMRVQGDGAERFAGYSHVARCGSVWLCPTCSAKIAAVRAAELSEGFTRWGESGGGLTFVTLTMRHHKGQRLADLWNGVAEGWAGITRGASWTGSARQVGDKNRFGLVGTVRATEVTHGDNGWHVHLHVLVFSEAPLTDSAAGDLGVSMFRRWKNRLVGAGFEAPLMLHGGLDVQTVNGAAAEKKLGEYLSKATYEGAGWETAGGSMKSGRGGGRSPFQILHDLRTTGEGLDLWEEWEAGSKGRRQIVWSRGLFERVFGMTRKEKSDQEVADEEPGGDELGRFTKDGWRSMYRRPTRLPEALEVAEAESTTDESRQAVATWCRDREIGFRTGTGEGIDPEATAERLPEVFFGGVRPRSTRGLHEVPASVPRQAPRRSPVDQSTLTDEQREHLAKVVYLTAQLP